jgi:hypothetical protein
MNENRRPLSALGAKVRNAMTWKLPAQRYLAALLLGGVGSLAMAAGCGDRERRVPVGTEFGGAGGPGVPDRCLTPNEGCECEVEGDQVDCGRLAETFDDYVTCQMGTRTCTDGLWGACTGDRITVKSIQRGTDGLRPLGLGSSMVCPKDAGVEFDVCDPYCNVTPDTPVGHDAGPGFDTNDAGITLTGSAVAVGIPCTTLTLAPVPAKLNTVTPATVKVTAFSPVTTSPAGPVTFTLTPGPMGCAFTSPYATTWVTDAVDRATISGTNNTNGQLALNVPIGGPVTVTAYALGLTASTTFTYRVNVVEAPTTSALASPNRTSTTAAINGFSTVANACAPSVLDGCRDSPNVTATASTATWLYPQAATFLPLGLPAPWIQYLYPAASTAGAVKVSLRYPVGLTQTAAATIFNYSLIVREGNGAAEAFAGITANTLDPQVVIPQNAWQYFEQTGRGNDVDLIIQRRTGAGVVEAESRRTIRLVDGQLKGTVFYTSYNSQLAGDTGAVLRISPGATAPTVAVQPTSNNGSTGTRRCTVCHTVNTDGTRLIANGQRPSGIAEIFDISRRYDVSNPATAPYALPVLNNFDSSGPGPYTGPNIPGDRFTFGAPFLDGTLYMTHGGASANQGDNNWRAPPDYSRFYQITNALNATNTNPLTVTNWSNISAVTPAFSHDGSKLAFGFWGATGSTLPCFPTATAVSPCTGSPRRMPSDTAGTSLTVVDFSCASPPCTSSDTGWVVSNARDVTPGVTERVGWPSFTPNHDGVFFQRQYRTSKATQPRTVVQTGSGPTITVSGAPTALTPGLITITTGGSRTATRFSWSYGASSGTNVTPAATLTLGTTGLTVAFPTGTYVVGTTYAWFDSDIGVVGSGWSPSHINSVTGALAEIWLARVPVDGSVAAPAPTRLNALNGLNAAGTATALPTASRLVAPAQNTFHANNASFPIAVPDNCSNTGTATLVNDYRLNYFPSVAPTQAGGYTWVIFTSRRMFGNVAYDDPWDAAPGETCNSGVPPTKKLWVAAVDSTWTPGTDPSHPAFYLPGQELAAANADGDWVTSPCSGVGAACGSDDDCCNATGPAATHECRIVATTPTLSRTCQAKSSCSNIGSACTTTAQCCSGTCPVGGGVCFIAPLPMAPAYTTATTTRDYVANCPTGTQPAWRHFEWQATTPTGTSIEFRVQTSPDPMTTAYAPASPGRLVGTAQIAMAPISASGPGTWYRGSQTVDQVLAVAPSLPSWNYLRVTMRFNPNGTGSAAPTLHQWRQIYDCLPAQ